MTCPVCRAEPPDPFLTLKRVPIFCNVLHSTRTAACSAPCGDIELVLCPGCALVYNRSFDPARVSYSPDYDNPLHFSATFRTFASELSRRLVTEYRLAGGAAVEIGCGDGFFLDLLLKDGMREAIGYDPSMEGRVVDDRHDAALRIVPTLFQKQLVNGPIDAIICRHVLEHLPDPLGFIQDLREAIESQNPLIYFEVPNGEWVLQTTSVWDVIYEHFTYWTAVTLGVLFDRTKHLPISVSTGFGHQFLMLKARPHGVPTLREWLLRYEARRLGEICKQFGKASAELIGQSRTALGEIRAHDGRVVLWGGGSKGVTFANVVAGNEPLLAGIVDINPNKQGKYIGGCGLPVLAPSELTELRPDVVLLMNSNYAGEVSTLLDELGLKPEMRHVDQWSRESVNPFFFERMRQMPDSRLRRAI
jgi:hypothetical protein